MLYSVTIVLNINCCNVLVIKIVKIWRATGLLFFMFKRLVSGTPMHVLLVLIDYHENAIPIEHDILLLYHWTIELRILKCIIVWIIVLFSFEEFVFTRVCMFCSSTSEQLNCKVVYALGITRHLIVTKTSLSLSFVWVVLCESIVIRTSYRGFPSYLCWSVIGTDIFVFKDCYDVWGTALCKTERVSSVAIYLRGFCL